MLIFNMQSLIFSLTTAGVIIFVVIKIFKKHAVLNKGDNVITATAEITSVKQITYNFVVKLYEYEYNFNYKGITYTGKYYQNSIEFKKNGQPSVSQKVLFDITDPSKNRLEIDTSMNNSKKIFFCAAIVLIFIIFYFWI